MKFHTKFLILLMTLFLQSCFSLRTKDNNVFSNSTNRMISNENLENINFEPSIKPLTFYKEECVIFVVGDDSIKLNNEFSFYSELFSSGIITPKMLNSQYSTLAIYSIDELTNVNKKSKTHKYEIYGILSSWVNGVQTITLNGNCTYIEIKSKKAFESKDYKENLSDARVSFCLTLVH